MRLWQKALPREEWQRSSFSVSIEPELAINGAQVGRPEQGLVGHPHAIERPIEIGSPERQELVELGKGGKLIHTLRRPIASRLKAQEVGRLTIDRDPIAFALCL